MDELELLLPTAERPEAQPGAVPRVADLIQHSVLPLLAGRARAPRGTRACGQPWCWLPYATVTLPTRFAAPAAQGHKDQGDERARPGGSNAGRGGAGIAQR